MARIETYEDRDPPENERKCLSKDVNIYRADGHLRKLSEIEAEVIRLAVVMYRGRTSEIARRLRVGRTTVYRKLDELGIGNEDRSAPHDRVPYGRESRKITK
jgi:DNA-binding NtrC family response regulator